MTETKPVVFLGPTMAVEEASHYVDAIFLPPARQGDLLSAAERFRPPAIAIIDGLFLQDLSVWHKEVLWAMERGVAVLGASSMGALRAAELHTFGMIGVGWIFRQYASGAFDDDDEVVLAHGPAESGYKKIAEPLVNIRATLAAAVTADLLTATESEAIVSAMKALYFPERTIRRMLAEASRILPLDRVSELRDFFQASYVDVKRDDAIELLQILAAEENLTVGRPIEATATSRGLCFETLRYRDRHVDAGEVNVSLGQIARYAALHAKDFEAVRGNALNRTLAALLADLLGIVVSEDDVKTQRKRFCHERRIESEMALSKWLEVNHWSSDEFEDVLRNGAKCHAVHAWWRSTAGHRGVQAKVLLNELRLNGYYPRIVEGAARQQQRSAKVKLRPQAEEYTADTFRKTTVEFSGLTGFRVSAPLHEWAEEAGFLNLADLHNELVSATAAAHSDDYAAWPAPTQ